MSTRVIAVLAAALMAFVAQAAPPKIIRIAAPDLSAGVMRTQQVHLRSLMNDSDVVLEDLTEASELAWIAGAEQFAFLSDCSGSTQVWVYDVPTQRAHMLTNSSHPVVSFAFSAGGKRLVYASRAAAASSESLYDRFREDEQ